jgi:3',5'-cyclic-AMP phosphodiesterase
VRVVQITDTHIPADPADQTVIEMVGGIDLLDPVDTLSHILDDIAALDRRPDLVVATGDLGDRGHRASYLRLNAMLNDLGIPALCIPGNHDLPDELDRSLPGGCVEIAHVHETGGWTFCFARTGNTEWGELGAGQVASLDAALDRRDSEPVFLWMHHPPAPLTQGYLSESPFLADDVSPLLSRHDVRGIAAGHVHAQFEIQHEGIPLFTTPSTHIAAPGPGYRIFDFDAAGFTSEVRAFPAMTSMTDEKLATLRRAMTARVEAAGAIVARRGDEQRARAEVLEWQHEADERRARPAMIPQEGL